MNGRRKKNIHSDDFDNESDVDDDNDSGGRSDCITVILSHRDDDTVKSFF